LISAFVILVGLDDFVLASSITYQTEGNWNGVMNGSGFAQGAFTINVNSTMDGAFNEDTSGGIWNGTYIINYQVSPVEIDGQDSGNIIGTYTMNISESGIISGEVIAQVTEVLFGELLLTIHGMMSESGVLNGSLNGTLVGNTLRYGGTPVPLNDMILEVSGEFEGNSQKIDPTPPTASLKIPEQENLEKRDFVKEQNLVPIISVTAVIIALTIFGLEARTRIKQTMLKALHIHPALPEVVQAAFQTTSTRL
jgi:hypothetical protein